MKKYIVSILVTSVFLAGAPFVAQKVFASDMSIGDFINLLITIGVIPPEKMPAVNAYFTSLNNNISRLPTGSGLVGDRGGRCPVGQELSLDGLVCVPYTISQPAIIITSPGGGESYKIGDRIQINWDSKNLPADATVSIELTQKTAEVVTAVNPYSFSHYGVVNIGENLPNSGSFQWVIPVTITENNNYEINITSSPINSQKGVGSYSAQFSILGGHPIIVSTSPSNVSLGGTIRIIVDASNSGVADQVKSILVSLQSIDGSSYVPANFSSNIDSQSRWYVDYIIPRTAKLGSWVVGQIGLFDNEKVIKSFSYPNSLNQIFTIVPASN